MTDKNTLSEITRRVKINLKSTHPWISIVNVSTLREDFIAGLTSGMVVLPQAVAFAIIAGLPPEYGLYSALVIPLIAALFGSSWTMISGPTTAISAILFATLSVKALPGTPDYLQLAFLLTVMVGVLQCIAGLVKLGALIAFISHSVILGFTAAAAVLIIASQLAPALGILIEGSNNPVEDLIDLLRIISDMNFLALSLSFGAVAVIVFCQTIDKRIPGILIALILSGICGYFLSSSRIDIELIAPLSSALPSLQIPKANFNDVISLLPGAATIAFIALLEAISIGRAFAIRRNEPFDANQEIKGQGLSNVIGGIFQCYAGSGSFTRSALNAEAGARTPIAAIFSVAVLFLLVVTFTPYVRYIPVSAMAGIILYVAWRLINFEDIRHIFKSSRSETLILSSTFLSGTLIELKAAIICGVVISLFVFLGKTAKPLVAAMAPAYHDGRRSFRGALKYNIPQCPQIALYRIEGPLYFASLEHVANTIATCEEKFNGRKFFIFHLRGVGTIDLAGADFISNYMRNLRAQGGDLILIATRNTTLLTLEKTRLTEAIGPGHIFLGKAEAIASSVNMANDSICKNCKLRAFYECRYKPAPAGFEHYVAEHHIGDTL